MMRSIDVVTGAAAAGREIDDATGVTPADDGLAGRMYEGSESEVVPEERARNPRRGASATSS